MLKVNEKTIQEGKELFDFIINNEASFLLWPSIPNEAEVKMNEKLKHCLDLLGCYKSPEIADHIMWCSDNHGYDLIMESSQLLLDVICDFYKIKLTFENTKEERQKFHDLINRAYLSLAHYRIEKRSSNV